MNAKKVLGGDKTAQKTERSLTFSHYLLAIAIYLVLNQAIISKVVDTEHRTLKGEGNNDSKCCDHLLCRLNKSSQ